MSAIHPPTHHRNLKSKIYTYPAKSGNLKFIGGKMRNVMDAIHKWRHEGKQVALATVISATGSAPRREGAKLVVDSA